MDGRFDRRQWRVDLSAPLPLPKCNVLVQSDRFSRSEQSNQALAIDTGSQFLKVDATQDRKFRA